MQRIHTLLYFKSPTCKPCERTTDVLDAYSLSQLEARVITIDITAEDAFEYTLAYNVRSVPTVIALDEEGNVLNRLDGCGNLVLDDLIDL